tara:strand:- start:208 stop:582 length:375 start_codon:yes stop_codon:yes gene_type:complete
MNVNDLFKASFGSYGSVYLSGNGSSLNLSGSSANRFVLSITFLTDTKFTKIETLDGIIGSISTDDANETQIDDAFGATTHLTDNDSPVIDNTVRFPKGLTIYGKWDYITLYEGSCLCYLAPVGY